MGLKVADGRTLRREKSRQRIIDAMVELLGEDNIEPTAEQIAKLAGVTMRTVFRHFDDMESLYGELLVDMKAQIDALHVDDNMEQGWRSALDQLIDRRAHMFEKFMPRAVAAQALRHRIGAVDEDVRGWVTRMRLVLKNILPDRLLADPLVFAGIEALLSWDMWLRLRRDQGLSIKRSKAVIQNAIDAILKNAGESRD
jgi:AcrR family transcriptional regulator